MTSLVPTIIAPKIITTAAGPDTDSTVLTFVYIVIAVATTTTTTTTTTTATTTTTTTTITPNWTTSTEKQRMLFQNVDGAVRVGGMKYCR